MHGFPVSSSGSRTALGDALGSRTQLYSVVTLVFVLVVMVAGRGVLSNFPMAALGALVVYAALRLVDVPEFKTVHGIPLRKIWALTRDHVGIAIIASPRRPSRCR